MPPIMTPEQAAAWLGCEPRTVQENCRSGVIPAVKFGVDWAIPAEALLKRVNWLAERESETRTQPAAAALVKVAGRDGPPALS